MSDKEKLAQWMIRRGYSTGHADSMEDLLQELDWQIAEKKGPVTFVCSTGSCRFTLTQTNLGIKLKEKVAPRKDPPTPERTG